MLEKDMMTEQEAQAIAARVQRIWKPFGNTETLVQWHFHPNAEALVFVFALTKRVFFSYQSISGRVRHRLVLRKVNRNPKAQNDNEIAILVYQYDWPREKSFVPDSVEKHIGEIEEFFTQYVPLFRRNCWLSGCNIEATAHEKAEWIRGLTREEVETWHLKL